MVVADSAWRRFAALVLEKAGVRADVRDAVVAGLCETSLRGVDSHGIRLLPHYVLGVEKGRINPNPSYQFTRKLPTSGLLDADHTFGHAAGTEAIRHAMDMAEACGMGAVAVQNSTHFGAAAFFALQAARRGFLAFSFTHADALVMSHGGVRPFFGTNPLCFAAPAEGEDPFCLDMSVGHMNWNQVLQRREKGAPLPDGVAADELGRPINDAQRAKCLLPIGAYKGYGIAAMVEVLCSLLTGMPFGRDIPPMYTTPMDQRRYLGHFFLVLRTDGFVDLSEFKERMKALMDAVRREPASPGTQVKLAGDPEKEAMARRTRNGIPVDQATWSKFAALADRYGVPIEPLHR